MISTATAHAATYYIDAEDGNDSNSGLSEGDAWQTISKVSAFTFSAGDNILFKRNQTHIGRLLLQNETGTAGNRLTISAYGAGNKPILHSTNTQSIVIRTASYVTVEDLEFLNTAGGGSIYIGDFPDSKNFDHLIFKNLIFNSTGTPYSIAGGNNGDIFNHLLVSDIVASGMIFSSVFDSVFENVVLSGIGLSFGFSSYPASERLRIENLTVSIPSVFGYGLYFSRGLKDSVISNFTHTGGYGALSNGIDVDNLEVNNLVVTGGSSQGFALYGKNITINNATTTNNGLHGALLSSVPQGSLVINNLYSANNGAEGVKINTGNVTLKNSVFKNNGDFGISHTGDGTLDLRRNLIINNGKNSIFKYNGQLNLVHNTIISSSTVGVSLVDASSTLQNNLLSTSNGVGGGIFHSVLTSGSIVAKNNLIHSPTPTTGFTPDPSNLITLNPRLHPDYSPKDNSPAIDSALPLPSYTHDFFHKPLYKLPDIGAIEWHPLYQTTNPASTQVSQEVYTEISLTLPTTTLKMSPSILGLTGGSSYGYTGSFYIKTNNSTGYQATLNFSTSTAMQRVGGGGHINNYIPLNPAVPDAEFRNSTSSHWFGYRVGSDSSKTYLSPLFKTNFLATACNAGTDVYIGRCWYNQVDATIPLTIMSRNSKTSVIGDDFHLQFQINVAENPTPALPEGMYQATATVTVLPN